MYELNVQGTELYECKLSEEEFQELTHNPVCAYQEKETEKWHLGRIPSEQNDVTKKFYLQYDPEPFWIDDESTEEENIEELLYSWEDFAVYEALDVSGWEKKLTTEERRQLRLMADTMGNFGTEEGGSYFAEYAVCDLNQDGTLELLVRVDFGSGIVRTFYNCYALDEEIGIKNVMTGEKTRRSLPQNFSEEEKTEAEGEDHSVQTETSVKNFLKCFLFVNGGFDEVSCYQDIDGGEIRYVFEAEEEIQGLYGENSDSFSDPYEMYWNGHELFIESPEEKSSKGVGKQGKAYFRWMDRHSMACPDYQYENILASYLGWELRWMAVKD